MKFNGGSVEALAKELKAAFPKDNVVVSFSLQNLSGHKISEFEVRDVRLKELGRTIEFLSEGKLIVEVVESEDGAAGNIWRIGSHLGNNPPSVFTLQIRSVVAPYLFRDKEKADRVGKDAQNAEAGRLKRMLETIRAGYNDIVGGARVEMLPDQHLFVIVGSEAGIAGVGASSRPQSSSPWRKRRKKETLAASLSPKMPAVLAPHLFNNQARLDQVTKECDDAQKEWILSCYDLIKRAGLKDDQNLVHGALSGLCLSQILRERDMGADFAVSFRPADVPGQTSPPSLQRSKYVTIRTMEQARKESLPMPDGITQDQAKVLIAARGLPLLLVRDRAGKVARIHVIER